MPKAYPLRDRIMNHFIPEPNSGCWLWTGQLSKSGYGIVKIRKPEQPRFSAPAHRLLYEMEKGPVPRGLELDHLCRVRCCINPDHLEAVTPRVNNLRGQSPAALAAKRTHCDHGHPFAGSNLYNPYGKHVRVCRQCAVEASARYVARKKAIEFGEYLAAAAEQFMAEQNRAAEAGEDPDSEYWSGLQSAVYEFRKRAKLVVALAERTRAAGGVG